MVSPVNLRYRTFPVYRFELATLTNDEFSSDGISFSTLNNGFLGAYYLPRIGFGIIPERRREIQIYRSAERTRLPSTRSASVFSEVAERFVNIFRFGRTRTFKRFITEFLVVS